MMLVAMVFCYAAGIVVPPCFAGRPRAQNVIAHGAAGLAGALGVMVGIAGLVAAEPLTASVPSTLPFLAFAIRLDPLASFFLLTISLTSATHIDVTVNGTTTTFNNGSSDGTWRASLASALNTAPRVAPADVRVRVLNGSGTAGAAGEASAALGSAGWKM